MKKVNGFIREKNDTRVKLKMQTRLFQPLTEIIMFYQCTFITTHNIYKCNLPIKIYNTIQIMYFTNINARRPITYQLSQTTKIFHLHILKDILFAIGDGYQIQSPKCTLFHHPRDQDCESSRPECLDLLQRICTHPQFLTCLNSCF